MTSFSTIPSEIFRPIISRDLLRFDDILSFSLCSKECRDRTLPILFKGIKLNLTSAKALDKGESLWGIGPEVRYATVKISEGYLPLVDECRVYVDCLEHLTNL
ncbi:hypothetical protein TWF281_002609 [Arthrobotrys megalospora]